MAHSDSGPLGRALRMLGGQDAHDMQVRQAAWVARCVGRGELAPLGAADVDALAGTLWSRPLEAGEQLFAAGRPSEGVWIVRSGQVELSVGTGRRRAVVDVLRAGDVDGDIFLLLDMASPYTARALTDAVCLFLSSTDFDALIAQRPRIARRWLSSVAGRLAASQARILGLLGRSLTGQVAGLLLDEQVDGTVHLAQRTLAAMLGVQRPSLNKVLKDLEREKLIAVRYGAVDVLDADRLARHIR